MRGRLIGIGLGVVVLAALGGLLWATLYSLQNAGDDAPTNTPPAVPDGVSVERVRIGERTVWCAINYNGGISCDFTREATKS